MTTNGTYIGVCKNAVTVHFWDSSENSDKSSKNFRVPDSPVRV
jgi:hypothetical protein